LSEIERWLDNQVTISTTLLISYLSSPEGLHILRQITDNRPLSSQIVNKLAKLVTQDDIRSSVEKFDTNKIYGVFLGSAFLTQIQAHVGAMIEPKPEDLWPFVRLLEEMQNRTSDGWRFLPAETLREAIDEIPDGAEKFELYQQFCKLVEYRNKMKRLQQLSKLEDHYQVRVILAINEYFVRFNDIELQYIAMHLYFLSFKNFMFSFYYYYSIQSYTM